MQYSRRDLGKLALTAVPAIGVAGALTKTDALFAQNQNLTPMRKPNSLLSGVQIGMIIPYSFGNEGGDAANLLWHAVNIGISAVEMQNTPAEAFAGVSIPAPAGGGRGGGGAAPAPGGPAGAPAPGAAPAGAPAAAPGGPGAAPAAGRAGGGGGGRGNQPPPTPEQQAAQAAQAAELRKRRLSVSMDRYKALRKLYNDAGVSIYGFKLGLNLNMTDEEYDYTFNAAEALGATHVTMELPTDEKLLKRIGDFAMKRKIYAAYHTHGQGNFTAFDRAFEISPGNASNVDVGHYYGATGESALRFLQKWHPRVMSYHMKDKTGPKTNPANQNRPWGQGETPLKEILQAHRQGKWKSIATIELEYQVPEGSSRAQEIAKCLQYCKDALA